MFVPVEIKKVTANGFALLAALKAQLFWSGGNNGTLCVTSGTGAVAF